MVSYAPFMGKLYTYVSILAVLLGMAGCQLLLQEAPENNVDADVLATYFDGPKVRPGVALAISVTATGTQGQAAKQYFVDADGYIAMNGETVVKKKTLTIANATAENSLEDNEQIFNTFATLIGGISTPIEMTGIAKQTIVFDTEANE